MVTGSSIPSASSPCKRCKARVISGVKCRKCESVFHLSCAKLWPQIQLLNDGVICCNSESVPKDTLVTELDSDTDNAFFDAIEEMSAGNKRLDAPIFIYILKQKDLIIKELRDKIKLLSEQVTFLSAISEGNSPNKDGGNKSERKQIHKQKQSCSFLDIKPGQKQDEAKPLVVRDPKKNSKQNNSISSKQLSADLLQIQTELKCNEIINLEPAQKIINTPQSQHADWQQVDYNKGRRQHRIVGNNTDTVVKGVPRFVGLHVYRIDVNATVQDLENSLKEHFHEVKCEKMNAKHPELYSSYKVTIHEKNFRKAMNPSLWPTGACVSKFFHYPKKQIQTT